MTRLRQQGLVSLIVRDVAKPYEPSGPIEAHTRCCAACRRGTPALGPFPCGNGDCHCHDGDPRLFEPPTALFQTESITDQELDRLAEKEKRP